MKSEGECSEGVKGEGECSEGVKGEGECSEWWSILCPSLNRLHRLNNGQKVGNLT